MAIRRRIPLGPPRRAGQPGGILGGPLPSVAHLGAHPFGRCHGVLGLSRARPVVIRQQTVTPKPKRLSVRDHDRDVVGKRYVYAVVSRRSGGVSVGVNLNPDNTCNWRCVYCQVPELREGKGPPIDLELLDRELRGLLGDLLDGDFMRRRVPEGARRLADVAFSGNGEPTTSPHFRQSVEVVARVLEDRGLAGRLPLVLITNGTMMRKSAVQHGARRIGELAGEVWFKLDAGSSRAAVEINGQPLVVSRHLERLRLAASLCPTWVQTCMVSLDGLCPDPEAVDAYLDAVGSLAGVPGVKGVLLYTLARPSRQPAAGRLGALSSEWLQRLGSRIEERGLACRVSS